MLDDLSSKFLEVLVPRPEMTESTVEVIQNRVSEGDLGIEAAAMAVTAMLGGVIERNERVENIAQTSDVLASAVQLDQDAQTVRNMAAGNQIGLDQPDESEAERMAYIERLEADAKRFADEARNSTDDQFALA